MPRKGVPYGGGICRLKERIAELFDLVGEKLHSINGVQGDGSGNVEIVSGDAAVVIDNNQVGHNIEISLDSSQLPAASVSSVNGQTGAVALDAGDIPSDGDSTVQSDISAHKSAINACSDAIGSEQTARQNADATLQTNINRVQASIPEMSMTPDPYKGVERDAQGRALAADPAAGATDKTLVTANWVSQTGNSAPNNLVHRTGNETITGNKSFSGLRVEGTGYYGIVAKKANFSRSDRSADHRSVFRLMEDCDNKPLLEGFVEIKANGINVFHLGMFIIDSNGTMKEVDLLSLKTDASGNVTYLRVGGRGL